MRTSKLVTCTKSRCSCRFCLVLAINCSNCIRARVYALQLKLACAKVSCGIREMNLLIVMNGTSPVYAGTIKNHTTDRYKIIDSSSKNIRDFNYQSTRSYLLQYSYPLQVGFVFRPLHIKLPNYHQDCEYVGQR